MIEYHDVSKDAEAGRRFGIRSIPTTVFMAPSGKELIRRQGYLSEEDIVSKWNEIGFDLKKGIGYDADE